MQNIAICESNAEDSAALQNMLDDYEKENRLNFRVRTFRDAESLIVSITCGDFKPDILLTGIFLPGMSGIEAVRKLRELGFYGSVIFTTSSPHHALTAYELDAAQYFVKPISPARLTSTIDRIVGAGNDSIVVRQRRAMRKIMCRDILYCETRGRYQVIHTQTEEISVRMTARAMRKLVPPPPSCKFTTLGSAYLLNLCKIIELNKGRVVFEGGAELLLSTKKFRALVKSVKECIKL